MRPTFQLKIEPQPDYVLALLSGPFDLPHFINAAKEIFAATYARGLRRIVIDARALEGEITLMDRFEMARMGAEMQRQPLRLAFIASEHHIWPDRFGENVANNRGLATKVTTSETEALEWLHRDSVASGRGEAGAQK